MRYDSRATEKACWYIKAFLNRERLFYFHDGNRGRGADSGRELDSSCMNIQIITRLNEILPFIQNIDKHEDMQLINFVIKPAVVDSAKDIHSSRDGDGFYDLLRDDLMAMARNLKEQDL